MIYRSLSLSVILRLLLLVLITLFFYNRLIKVDIPLIIFSSIFLIISIAEFLYFINNINRKLSYFFDAIKNEDSSLSFSSGVKDKSLKMLHESLNNVNKVISDIKIENAKTEKFYSELLKFSSSGILAIDDNGYVSYINNLALHYVGVASLSHINLLKQKNNKLYEILTKIKPEQPVVLKLKQENELIQVSLRLTEVTIEKQKILVFTFINIKAELEENEIESWQKLIRVLTHEIMNSIAPITSLSNTIKGYFLINKTLIKKEKIDKNILENTLEGISVIEERSKGLEHFVQNYRQLTKIPIPNFNDLNLKEFINRILLLKKTEFLDSNINVDVDFSGVNTLKLITADEKLLAQVVINLLNNAVDALNKTNVSEKLISIKVFEDNSENLKIEITDNGSGVPIETSDKIFVPFFTTKEKGSGIGLSLSRQIMRLHRGSISFISKPGKTTFTLSF